MKVPIHYKIMFEEVGIDVPNAVVSRAHDRIDQSYANSKSKQNCRSIIIHFIHRT